MLLPALAREAELWREQGARDLWLLRKDPGLRLRLRNLELAAVRPGLARLQAAGLLSTWFPGVYEPEYHQFGGPAATAAVHTYFAADTRALLLAASSSQRRVSTTVVSLAILNDLFERCLQVHEEVWDVWSNLEAMYRGHARPGAALLPLGLAGLRRLGGPTELALADLYEHANTELAAALAATCRRGASACAAAVPTTGRGRPDRGVGALPADVDREHVACRDGENQVDVSTETGICAVRCGVEVATGRARNVDVDAGDTGGDRVGL